MATVVIRLEISIDFSFAATGVSPCGIRLVCITVLITIISIHTFAARRTTTLDRDSWIYTFHRMAGKWSRNERISHPVHSDAAHRQSSLRTC